MQAIPAARNAFKRKEQLCAFDGPSTPPPLLLPLPLRLLPPLSSLRAAPSLHQPHGSEPRSGSPSPLASSRCSGKPSGQPKKQHMLLPDLRAPARAIGRARAPVLDTGVAKFIHNQLVMVRVRRFPADEGPGTGVAGARQVLDALGYRAPVAIPFSDGSVDQVLLFFTCPAGDVERVATTFARDCPLADLTVLALALSKDTRQVSKQLQTFAGRGDLEAALAEASSPVDATSSSPSAPSAPPGPSAPPAPSTSSPTPAPPPPAPTGLQVFRDTIKSRIAVANFTLPLHESATFSFDFLMLIVLASCVAATGLLTNSTVSLIASMLISPLMAPLLAATFGVVIRDRALVKVGVTSASIAFTVCIVIGFVAGLCAAPAAMVSTPWPTSEMASRANPSSLYVGVAVALPSGMAVALGTTGGSQSALVGVAISVSLLPPAVNCGIMLAFAALSSRYYSQSCFPSANVTTATWGSCCRAPSSPVAIPFAACPPGPNAAFCCYETLNTPNDIALGALYSALLTLVNVACIVVGAISMFLVKEVAPLPSKADFWSVVVPQTRQFNVSYYRGGMDLGAFAREFASSSIPFPASSAGSAGSVELDEADGPAGGGGGGEDASVRVSPDGAIPPASASSRVADPVLRKLSAISNVVARLGGAAVKHE